METLAIMTDKSTAETPFVEPKLRASCGRRGSGYAGGMHPIRFVPWLVACAIGQAAPVRSGHATAEWLTVSSSCEPGKPLQTAIRLTLDPGWHTYWVNPGDGGMATTIQWRLPAGWTAGEAMHPVPMRMKTGGLAGFGHEGTLVIPVSLTAPADFTGDAKLEAEVSWLTCDESACVPGEAKLTLVVKSGTALTGPDEPVIREALKRVPKPLHGGATLAVEEIGNHLKLTIHPPSGDTRDFSAFEVFPETPRVLDPAAVIRFVKTGNHWSAEVAKSEYLSGPPAALSLVLADPKGGEAYQLSWTKR
jgi:thiol:disulfide interchange protein DsbD